MTMRRREGLVWAMATAFPLVHAAVPQLQSKSHAPPAPVLFPCLTHYDYPPFVTAPGAGLSHDLAALLKQQLNPWVAEMPVRLVSRRRLDLEIAQAHWLGMVPWVAPIWFGDGQMQRYVWSEPLMSDEDLVLSLKSRPVHYRGTESLKGLRFGGVAGHHYVDLDALLERRELQRDDAGDMGKNLQKLLKGRVDFIFLSRSGLPWWTQEFPEMASEIHVADMPRGSFQRRVLISPHLSTELRLALQGALAAMPTQPKWLELLARYGLGSVAAKPVRRGGMAIPREDAAQG